jgi:hypothetical protein
MDGVVYEEEWMDRKHDRYRRISAFFCTYDLGSFRLLIDRIYIASR